MLSCQRSGNFELQRRNEHTQVRSIPGRRRHPPVFKLQDLLLLQGVPGKITSTSHRRWKWPSSVFWQSNATFASKEMTAGSSCGDVPAAGTARAMLPCLPLFYALAFPWHLSLAATMTSSLELIL